MNNYHGIDWIIFVLFAIHLHLLCKMKKSGFLFGVAGCLVSIVFAIMIESYPLVAMNAFLLFLHVRSYLVWSGYSL